LFTAAVGILGVAAVTLTPATFDGTGSSGVLNVPRAVTITTSGAVIGNALVRGTDVHGNVVTETVALISNLTATSAACFATVTQIILPAQAGPGQTAWAGVADVLGASQHMDVALGGVVPVLIQEVVDGAAVAPTTGALTAPAVNPPNGGYIPAGGAGTFAYGITYPVDGAGVVVPPSLSGEEFGYYTPILPANGFRSYALFFEFNPTV
jgi:hypothetical protein